MIEKDTNDVMIVGGGMAGLAAAVYLARANRKVTLFEKSHLVGGRATTHKYDEFWFNQGPHALYRGGAGLKILQELGIQFEGGVPNLANALTLLNGELKAMPTTPAGFATTDLFSLSGKLELGRFLAMVMLTQPEKVQDLSFREWMESKCRQPEVRQFLEAFARLNTYINAPEQMSAAVFVKQVQISLKKSVLYLNGGWQTLVDGLKKAAEQAGVTIISGAKVTAVEHDAQVSGVRLADGTFYRAQTVLMAASPEVASGLVSGQARVVLSKWAGEAIPVRAACLDVALRRLPQPNNVFVMGIDQPLYLSVHSEWAKLGPAGNAVIHTLKYLNPAEKTDSEANKVELENLLDLAQPGWREEVLHQRFLPHMTVINELVQAGKPRPAPQVPGISGLYLAGDWVWAEGLLVDASLASAKEAARLILSRTGHLAQAEISLTQAG